jgi:hypothetical protein
MILVAGNNGDQKVIAIHADCIPYDALGKCKDLLTKFAPEQAHLLGHRAAVPAASNFSAESSDDKPTIPQRESRVR